MGAPSQIGFGGLHDEALGGKRSGGNIATAVEIEVESGVVAPLGQIPAMNLRGPSLQRKAPVAQLRGGAVLGNHRGSCGCVQSKNAAHTVVFAAKKPKQIRERYFLPMSGNLRGLQARGGAGHITANVQDAGGLQGHTASPGLRFQPQLPAPRRNLLDISGNTQKGKGQLLITDFEIEAAVINVDLPKAVGRRRRLLRAVNAHVISGAALRGRKPAFQVPTALVIARENQTRPCQGQRAELEMAAQQTAPAQTSGQTVRAQKIFVAERRILANGNLFRLENRAGQQEHIEVTNFNASSKRLLEMPDEVIVDAMRASE